ncbi:MAG: hypothetical protein CMQ54_05445 [Gammaproteobacteria bacterium]|nr:hypothetical protein [Gammaproteobacteria bacterium]|tara:strand:- start:7638 stop:8189 length:552 start_codon:yes stop_codon:yes gene_type:complete
MLNFKKNLFMYSILVILLFTNTAFAASPNKINQESDKILKLFKSNVNDAEIFLNQAAGYLIFPRITKVGALVGVETGEGVLRVNDQAIEYYRALAGSFGFQFGAQTKSLLIVFMTKQSLEKFYASNGWKFGLDGSIAIIDLGIGKTIDTQNIKDPIVAFIFGSKGLMFNLTLEGSRFIKIDKT